MTKNSHTEMTSEAKEQDILIAVQRFVLHLFNQKSDTRLIYHNYQNTNELLVRIREIGQENNFQEHIIQTTELAGWFYELGRLFDYSSPVPKSVELALKFLDSKNYPTNNQLPIIEAIETIGNNRIPRNSIERLLADSVHAIRFGNDFFEKNPILRLEQELVNEQIYSKEEWAELQFKELLEVKFYTKQGKVKFEPIIAHHILLQKQIVEKGKNSSTALQDGGLPRKFQSIERKTPNSATQTFFRSNYRNHINLSAIADNKANIMISVNAILISVMISVISYRNITESNPMVLMPVVIFLVTGLSSLIFAVLSARPKVTSLNRNDLPLETIKQNIVFFGNFVSLDLEKYEEAMDAMFRDGELLYGNMTRDLYFLGKVLDKKYRYLTISYNIFMVGFVATVLTFMVALFL